MIQLSHDFRISQDWPGKGVLMNNHGGYARDFGGYARDLGGTPENSRSQFQPCTALSASPFSVLSPLSNAPCHAELTLSMEGVLPTDISLFYYVKKYTKPFHVAFPHSLQTKCFSPVFSTSRLNIVSFL